MSKLVRVYWRALLATSFMLVVGFSMYGVWQVTLLSELANLIPKIGASQSPLDRPQLKNVLESFQAREERYDFLEKNPPSIKDPSL